MPPPRKCISLGLDIGGTYVRCGRLDETGGFSGYRRDPLSSCSSQEDLLRLILNDLERLRNEHAADVLPIGLAFPGVLDERRTTVRRCVNLPWCEGWRLPEAVAYAAGLPTFVFTDAEAATWGEHSVHRPQPRRFVHLRLGTGVACGAVLNGELSCLDVGRARHLDFLVVDASDGARPCPCGRNGCLETLASGPALERAAKDTGFSSLVAFNSAVEEGDCAAGSLVDQTALMVVVAIERIVARFEPDVVSIGGGVLERVPSLGRRVFTVWEHSDVGTERSSPRVIPAALGDRAGAMGAALLAMRSAGCAHATVA